MSKLRYQLSPYIRTIYDCQSQLAMVYHALYGNPRVVNDEGLKFLELFKQPITIEKIKEICDGDTVDIIHKLVEIFFLIHPGFDEKEFLGERKKQHLLMVSSGRTIDRTGLAISDSCNFGCIHCIHYQPLNNNGKVIPVYQKSARQLNMSWEIAKQCIDRYVALMRENGYTFCKIHFGNGEPLINWSVIAMVLEYCSKMDDLIFEFSINTNLVLMTREIAEMLKRYRIRIATSLDGTRIANDAIRITKDGRGTFDQILEKFNLLSEIGYPLDGFSITVTKRNFNLIDTDIIDLAAEKSMTSIAFDYDLINLIEVPVAVRVEKLIWLKRYANERNIDFFGTWDSPFRNLRSESLLFGNHAFCAAVEGKSLEFNVDGSIKICGHVNTQVGHIDHFNEIFQEDSQFIQLVKERFPGADKYCSGCSLEGPCGGQCHVTREVVVRLGRENGQRFFADMCNFYRLVTEALTREYLRSKGKITVDNSDCYASSQYLMKGGKIR